VPLLDLPALTSRLQSRTLAPVHLLVGEDTKLVDRIVDGIEATIDEADRPFACERLHAGEPGGTPLEIVSAARIMPMLGDRRVVIVLRAERLLKPKRKSASDEVEEDDAGTGEAIDASPLEDYLTAPVPSTALVFVATEIDRTRRLTKRLLEKAYVTEFAGLASGGPGGRQLGRQTATEWLQDELTRVGKGIDADAARLVVARAGHDITKMRGDVERLLLFTEGRKRISTDDVMEVVSADVTVEDEWAVVNAIAEGNLARALTEVGARLERGDSPHAIVGQLRWWVSTRLVDGDPTRVRPALEALLRTDMALKSSGGEERMLVERLVMDLTGRPIAQRGGWGGRR
jgi:DNA polymerase III delta subunit